MANHTLLRQTTNPWEDLTNCNVSKLECTQQKHSEVTPVESPGLENEQETNPSKKRALTQYQQSLGSKQ
jgi:hypothetical protein